MAIRPLLLHIGLPKTGSTAIQRHIFQHLAGVTYISTPDRGCPDSQGRGLLGCVLRARSLADQKQAQDLGQLFAAARAELSGSGNVLISHEGLSAPIKGGLDAYFARLHAVTGPAQVLLVVRGLADMIRSSYGQHLTNTLSVMLNPAKREKMGRSNFNFPSIGDYIAAQMNKPHGLFDMLAYDDRVRTLAALYGRDAVTVFQFEDLIRDSAQFAASVAQWAAPGTAVPAIGSIPRENPAGADFGELLLRAAADISPDILNQIRSLFADTAIPPHQATTIADFERRHCTETLPLQSSAEDSA